MKLLVGLGNPGRQYARQRHNVGFMAIDAIAAAHRASPWKPRFQGLCAEIVLGDMKCLLLKPETFMNDSGRAVGEAVRFHRVAITDIIVFHDELDLAAGKVRVKTGGGNAGHNGLRSISHLVGNDTVRVRIGIGHPGVKELVHAWVLGDFLKDDAAWLLPLLDAMAHATPFLVTGDAPRFMTEIATAQGGNDREPARKTTETQSPEYAKRGAAAKPAAQPAASPTTLREKLGKWLKNGA